MGLQLLKVENDYYHLEMVGIEKHKVLINREMTKRGRLGIGTVHHIAWSVSDKDARGQFKNHFEQAAQVTAIRDRKYFNSVYFKDPGKLIYELAIVESDFTVDEPFNQLGTTLMLLEQYENQRDEIEARLPKLK